jgi:hypothetical protein
MDRCRLLLRHWSQHSLRRSPSNIIRVSVDSGDFNTPFSASNTQLGVTQPPVAPTTPTTPTVDTIDNLQLDFWILDLNYPILLAKILKTQFVKQTSSYSKGHLTPLAILLLRFLGVPIYLIRQVLVIGNRLDTSDHFDTLWIHLA